MNAISIALLALAVSTDAFAAAVGKGAALHRPRWSEALRTGVIFGAVEALTPLVGWALGRAAAPHVAAWDHWIAFAVLGGLGLRMAWSGLAAQAAPVRTGPARHPAWLLAATALGTSIDALAVGASLAFIETDIVVTAAAIGVTTTAMAVAGTLLGRAIGVAAGRRAELLGGMLLVAIGASILVEHLSGRA